MDIISKDEKGSALMKKIQSVIFVSVALSALGSAVILPILAPLIRELGLSESQGGWMISIGSVVMASSAPGWGLVCDRLGRKFVMLAGFAGLSVTFALYTTMIWLGLNAVLTGTLLFILLVVARALVGGFLLAAPSGALALMADHTTESKRSSGMAVIGAANGVGFVVGPAIGGALALFGIIWPLFLTTVLCFVAFFFVLSAIPKTPPQWRRGRQHSVNPFAPELFAWLLAGVLIMGSIFTIQIAGGFYFQDKLGLKTSETGPMLAIGLTIVGVSLFLIQVLQVKLLHWSARRLVIIGPLLWIIGVLILLYTANAPCYYFAYGFLGAGAGMIIPGYMAGASLAVPADKQGAVAGFSSATQGIGGILAPVASTVLYEIDKTLPLWGMVAMMGLIVLLFALPNTATRVASPKT